MPLEQLRLQTFGLQRFNTPKASVPERRFNGAQSNIASLTCAALAHPMFHPASISFVRPSTLLEPGMEISQFGSAMIRGLRQRNYPLPERIGPTELAGLYDEVLNNRSRYEPVLQSMRSVGFEDPFQITPQIQAHVDTLFDIHKPCTELHKAILLFRSVIPEDKSFIVNSQSYYGLNDGLGIKYNDDALHISRKEKGSLLPTDIIETPPDERIALCLEYSHLLVCLLRAAGLTAHPKGEPFHTYVIADLDGYKYQLDAAHLKFRKTLNGANSDRQSIPRYYNNKGASLDKHGKFDEAIKCYDKATAIDPNLAFVWNNKGEALFIQGRWDEAKTCFNEEQRLCRLK